MTRRWRWYLVFSLCGFLYTSSYIWFGDREVNPSSGIVFRDYGWETVAILFFPAAWIEAHATAKPVVLMWTWSDGGWRDGEALMVKPLYGADESLWW